MIAIVKTKTKKYIRDFTLTEFLLGAILAIGFVFIQPYFKSLGSPPTDWIEFVRITVPNHQVGENPLVEHERNAYSHVRGTWFAEIHKVGDKAQVCESDTEVISDYNPRENRIFSTDLKTYINDPDCDLKAGKYTLTLSMRFKPNPLVQKQFYVISQPFVVSE